MMKIKKIIESPESNLCSISLFDRSGDNSGNQNSFFDRNHSNGVNGQSSNKKFSDEEEYLMYLLLRSGYKNMWKKLEKYFGDHRSKQEVMYHCNYWIC